MAEHMLNDQQQQEQQNQIQPYGVSFGTRAKSRGVPYIPHVPAMIGAANLRARPLPVIHVREQQDVMLQDNNRVNQDMLQHNIQHQDNIAYDRRQYPDPQRGSSKAPATCEPPVYTIAGGSSTAKGQLFTRKDSETCSASSLFRGMGCESPATLKRPRTTPKRPKQLLDFCGFISV